MIDPLFANAAESWRILFKELLVKLEISVATDEVKQKKIISSGLGNLGMKSPTKKILSICRLAFRLIGDVRNARIGRPFLTKGIA